MAWAGEVLEDRSNDIPVFWAEREGPVLGGLCFGVGQADEELWNAGVAHLVEHLTLFGIGPREHGFNGRVEGRSTTFWAEGTIDEVKDFLGAVAASLADLPIDRLDSERTVLMTEARTRSGSITNLLLHRRFGPRSWGLADLHEFGLESLGGDQVGDWAARHFVSGNAAIFLTADPEGFTVDLPAGGREPRRPVPDPIRGLELPAFDTGPPGVMAIGSTAERSTALQMSLQIAAKLASDSLRMGQGLTYSVEADYLHLDSDQAHVSLTASCLDEHAVTVRDGLLDVLEQQAADGPPREEVDAYLKGAARFEVDPRAIPSHLTPELTLTSPVSNCRVAPSCELRRSRRPPRRSSLRRPRSSPTRSFSRHLRRLRWTGTASTSTGSTSRRL